MTALCGSVYRKGEQIKWGFVSYTVVIFSALTVQTAMNLDIQSVSYIDNCNFPGTKDALPPGPYGYPLFIAAGALNVTPNAMFFLSDWLADGLMVSSLFDTTYPYCHRF